MPWIVYCVYGTRYGERYECDTAEEAASLLASKQFWAREAAWQFGETVERWEMRETNY